MIVDYSTFYWNTLTYLGTQVQPTSAQSAGYNNPSTIRISDNIKALRTEHMLKLEEIWSNFE